MYFLQTDKKVLPVCIAIFVTGDLLFCVILKSYILGLRMTCWVIWPIFLGLHLEFFFYMFSQYFSLWYALNIFNDNSYFGRLFHFLIGLIVIYCFLFFGLHHFLNFRALILLLVRMGN